MIESFTVPGAEKKEARIWGNIKGRLSETVVFQIHTGSLAKRNRLGKKKRSRILRIACSGRRCLSNYRNQMDREGLQGEALLCICRRESCMSETIDVLLIDASPGANEFW